MKESKFLYQFSFNSNMKILKNIKLLIFEFQISNPNLHGMIINKTRKIQNTSNKFISHRANNNMNQIKNL